MKRLIILLLYCGSLFSAYPPTPKHPVTLDYPGDKVVDPYLWLEKSSNPEVKKWDAEQNAYTENFLADYSAIPFVETRLNSLREPSSISFQAGNTSRIITIENEHCYIQEDENGEKVEFLNVKIDNFELSPDGRYFAYSLSKKGNEKPKIKVVDLITLTHLEETLLGNFQLNPTWHPNSKGFFYTAYPKGEIYHGQGVYYHRIGTAKNQLLLQEPKKIAWYYYLTTQDGNLEIHRSHNTNKGFNIRECHHLPLDDLNGEPKLQWRLRTRPNSAYSL